MSGDTKEPNTTMLWSLVEDVLVLVHADAPPSEAEFDAYLEYCSSELPEYCQHCMVVTPGQGPNPKQRERVNAILKRRPLPMRVAVVTDSTLVRGIVTALSWFNNGTKAFSKAKMNEAFSHLEVPIGAKSAEITIEVGKMKAALHRARSASGPAPTPSRAR